MGWHAYKRGDYTGWARKTAGELKAGDLISRAGAPNNRATITSVHTVTTYFDGTEVVAEPYTGREVERIEVVASLDTVEVVRWPPEMLVRVY